MNIPDPCTQIPPVDYSTIPPSPSAPPGARCWGCGHLWLMHTAESGFVSAQAKALPSGCTQCQSERLMLETVLEEMGKALDVAMSEVVQAVADEQCPDYPAPCNCDDPRIHGGH